MRTPAANKHAIICPKQNVFSEFLAEIHNAFTTLELDVYQVDKLSRDIVHQQEVFLTMTYRHQIQSFLVQEVVSGLLDQHWTTAFHLMLDLL